MTLPEGWTQTTLGALLHGVEAGKNVQCEERPPRNGEKGVVKVSAVSSEIFRTIQDPKTLPINCYAARTRPYPEGRFADSTCKRIA